MKPKTLITAVVIFLLGVLAIWLASGSFIADAGLRRSFGKALLVIAAAVLACLAFLFSRALRDLAETRDDLGAFGRELASGDYTARCIGAHHNRTSLRGLAIDLNEMAEQLEATARFMAAKAARLDAILNSMIDPLVMVDRNLWVQFMNTSASRVFSRNLSPDSNPFPLILLTASEKTETLVRDANETGLASEQNVLLLTSKGRRNFDLVAVPVREEGESEFTIIIFDDRTEEHQLQTMRSEFVANVTHELKSPLTSIRGFIETLRSRKTANEDVRERFLEIIDVEAERLEQLITDILVLSEIETAKTGREQETFNLNELVDEVLLLLDDKASEKKITIDADTEGEGVTVTASRSRLRQIFINLIDNAIKYSNPGGKVWIRCTRASAERVTLTVRDNGPGIDPQYHDRVFERFYRTDRGRSRDEGSTGLGLSIVKHIAQLYQGRAWVESEPGNGAEFIVDLKL